MEYKGYTGQITGVDEDQGLIHGRVADLIDVITFEGSTLEEVVQAFHESVDDYLEFCAERKDTPEKPFSGKFLVRIPPELHLRAAVAAKRSRQSLNAWVTAAVERQAQERRRGQPEKPEPHTNGSGRNEAKMLLALLGTKAIADAFVGAEDDDLAALLNRLERRLLRELRERGGDVPTEKPKAGKG